MSTFKNKNSLRTIEAQLVQKLKNNEARPKCTGSYKKKACNPIALLALRVNNCSRTSFCLFSSFETSG